MPGDTLAEIAGEGGEVGVGIGVVGVGVGVGVGGVEVPKNSAISGALAAAPGKPLLIPSASMTNRRMLWCWYKVVLLNADFTVGPISTMGMWPPP